jgi:hypothetical protein
MGLYALVWVPILLSLGLVAVAIGSWASGAMARVALALGLAALALSVYGAVVLQSTIAELQQVLGGLRQFDDVIPQELKERLGQ